ncbi:MAG TPA: thioredoxin [Sphingomonadales bacterium]
MATTAVTDANFEAEVLKSSGPVLVDFWAEWCGPCRQIGPALEQISDEMSGEIKVVKVNVDENPTAPAQYGVRSIPTMIIFKDGRPLATKIGALPKSALVDWIKKSIA